jgi:hypothetical protein
MQKHYTIRFWNQDPQINDCSGNRSCWQGKAKSLAHALFKAAKGHHFFRVFSVEVQEKEKVLNGVTTTSKYTIFRKDLYASFRREYSNSKWVWENILPVGEAAK